MSDDRIGQPMSLSQLVLLIGKRAADTQLERGDITKEEHKERIKILFPDLELVDNKAGGGMMNINDMIKPVSYKEGTRNGALVGDMEKIKGIPSDFDVNQILKSIPKNDLKIMLDQAMMENEMMRRSMIDPNDPETKSTSTYGTYTDADRLKVAMNLSKTLTGSVSEKDINTILKSLEGINTEYKTGAFTKIKEGLTPLLETFGNK